MNRRAPRNHWRRPYFGAPKSRWRTLADYALTAILLGLLILLASRLDRAPLQRFDAVPTVNDGDSLTIRGERVRLRGIDAPEYAQQCLNGAVPYPCGQLSRGALVRLVGGRPVSCVGARRDRYGRLLGDCMAGGTGLNRAQVEAGWAVAYGDFETEERSARERKAGIWAGSFERPQDWRRDHGAQAEDSHYDMLARIGDWLRELFRFR